MKQMRRRQRFIALAATLLLIALLFIISLTLALTVFKPKPPTIQLLSSAVDGIAPSVSFPSIEVELNLTLDLKLLVENRNHASFKHGQGKSFLLYQGNRVGEADVYPGLIPARGSATIPCRLTLEVEELASNLIGLINDVVGRGELDMETNTRIPGKISFLGIFRKHVVVVNECQLTIAVLDMNIRRQTCKDKTTLWKDTKDLGSGKLSLFKYLSPRIRIRECFLGSAIICVHYQQPLN